MIDFPLFNATAYIDTEIMMLYENMAAKTTTYSSSHPCPMSMCSMKKLKIQG